MEASRPADAGRATDPHATGRLEPRILLGRVLQLTGILAWLAFAGALTLELAPFARGGGGWVLFLAAMVSMAAADAGSGVVHWAADTWGRSDFPILGRAFIYPFRKHHDDPEEIARHGAIQTNGNNCTAAVPLLLLAHGLPLEPGRPELLFAVAFAGQLSAWVLVTNQLHKWAHQVRRPRLVSWLQRRGVILSPEHHAVHHTAPFADQYCITTGWFDAPLRRVQFFPRAERLISWLTSARPRAHGISLPQR